jgi:hypothetical protein
MGEAKTEFHWRVTRGIVLAACLASPWKAGSSPARAQAAPPAQVKALAAPPEQGSRPSFRLVNAKEGQLIVEAAKDQDEAGRDALDCSHLVHQTYLDAGFEYAYANSYELYAGNENFQRVRYPRAGDLIVWPGHVGIVLDPMEHSFYSLVSTGLEAQDYLGAYWKARGRPRFYRYKVEMDGVLTAAWAPAAPRTANQRKTSETATLAGGRASEGSSNSGQQAKPVSGLKKVNAPATVLPAPVVASNTIEVSQSIRISAGNKPPTSGQVADAISDLTHASGEVLRSEDPSRLALPVVIFDRFQVERLEIKRDHGWAHLQIDSRATIAGGKTNFKRQSEKARWELHKTESGWEVAVPGDQTYVPNDVAVRNLAAQLARLTEGGDYAAHQQTVLQQESQLANLLSGLLDDRAGAPSSSRKVQRRSQPAGGEQKSEKLVGSGGPS